MGVVIALNCPNGISALYNSSNRRVRRRARRQARKQGLKEK